MRTLLIGAAGLAVGCLPFASDASRCRLQADLDGDIEGRIDQEATLCLDAESQASDGTWYRGGAFDTPDAEVWILLSDSLPLEDNDLGINDVPARLNAYTDDGWYLGTESNCTAAIDSVRAAATQRGGFFVEGAMLCAEPLDELESEREASLTGVASFTVRIRDM